MENEVTLGSLLRDRRKKLKLTTEELAKKAAVNRTYITKIEKHNKLPSPFVMERICKALSSYDLFSGYIKMKYPDVYIVTYFRQAPLKDELEKIHKKLNKKNISVEETNKLISHISDIETRVQNLKVKALEIIKKRAKSPNKKSRWDGESYTKGLLPIRDILS